MKPVCVPCQRFIRPKRNGFAFVEGMPIGNNAPAGRAAPEQWKPYKLWHADLWSCPDCGAEIVIGAGREPIAEHYQDRFPAAVKQFGGDQLQVNDC
jgi:hypothetical protein